MKLNRLLPLAPLALALAATAPAQIENRVDLDGLDRLARMELLRSEAELQEAHRLAPLLGLPLRGVDRFGNTFALVSLRDNRPWYISTDNKNAAISTRTNLVHPLGGLGFSLAGNNQVIGIWDGGTPRTTHQEITGRVVLKDAEGLSGDHATHVAGTLIGAGVNANAKGMAFRAKLNAYGFNNDLSEIATAAGGGLRISNHSYGYITGWHFDGANWFWFGDTAISNLEDAGFGPSRQFQHMGDAKHVRLNGADRVELIMDRRRGAGEIVNLIDLQIDRMNDVVPDRFKPGMIEERTDVLL